MKPTQKEAVAERSAVRYDQNPDTRFFLCTTCHNHIALLREPFSLDTPTASVILENVDNLVIDNSETHSRVDRSTLANLYCVGCFTQIGYKFVQVEHSHDIIREGRILMDLRKLLFWNGQLIMDSIRMQPIVDTFPEQ